MDSDASEGARRIVDRYCLDRKLREALRARGMRGDDAHRRVGLAKALLTKIDDEEGASDPASFLRACAGDDEMRAFLGFNVYGGVTWLNKERLEEAVADAALYGAFRRDELRAARSAGALLAAASDAGYSYDALSESLARAAAAEGKRAEPAPGAAAKGKAAAKKPAAVPTRAPGRAAAKPSAPARGAALEKTAPKKKPASASAGTVKDGAAKKKPTAVPPRAPGRAPAKPSAAKRGAAPKETAAPKRAPARGAEKKKTAAPKKKPTPRGAGKAPGAAKPSAAKRGDAKGKGAK